MCAFPYFPEVPPIVSRSSTPPGTVPKSNLDELEMRIDRLNLLVQTLLRLLIEKKVVTEEEFRQWIDYVDHLDGKRDGRLAKEKGIRNCPACNRVNTVISPKCQYCGNDLPLEFLAGEPG